MSCPEGFIQPYTPVAQADHTSPPLSAHYIHHHSQQHPHQIHQQQLPDENPPAGGDDAFFLYKEAKGEINMANNTDGGRIQPLLFTRWQRVYMGIATAEAIIIFGLSSTIFGLVEVNVEDTNIRTRTLPVYLSIFLLAQVFALLYVFDALRARNVVQLILHLCLNFMLFLYAILQIPQTRIALEDAHDDNAQCGHFQNCIGPHSLWNVLLPLLIIPVILFGLAIIAFATLVRRLADEFGWDVYRYTGASTEIKLMLKAYQTLVSLLKLMLFFATAFCVAYLILITAWDSKKAEFIVTVVALPLLFIIVLTCGWALREENKFVMSAILVLMVAGMAYFIYKLSTLFLPRTSSLYTTTRITMAVLSISAVLILFVTFVYSVICMSNFGKGLKEVHANPRNRLSVLSCLPREGWDGEGGLKAQGPGEVGEGRRFEIE